MQSPSTLTLNILLEWELLPAVMVGEIRLSCRLVGELRFPHKLLLAPSAFSAPTASGRAVE
jgi:hypothetical protein